ncbi:amidohydrolase family protein [Nitrospirillum amazonense]|uniref:Imidazolonepropionase-like amidohydrolase n=1 Tax=Nitrospirillum amazonense TaxID=28077 RepID=A0A560KHU4_9PROT|nr:amidohydrolase family protein [Nitrospirillum amazonense]MDG3443007.1 amidohydrolase family protein [Nitrospirillum amazonense]TWB82851.1 imidazolonepropionase-like amidohydrolase [Nitrospirillum amazonense]
MSRRHTLMGHTLMAAASSLVLLAGAAGAETVAITNARIETMGPAGEIPSGTILIRDGRIQAVGASVSIPADARRVDAKGHIVTPGLVASDTSLGAGEVEGEASSNDFAGATAEMSASFDVSLGINPASMLVPVARVGGVTRALVTPELSGRGEKKGEKLFAGQAAVVDMSGGTDSITKRRAVLVVDVGIEAMEHLGGSHGGVLQLLESSLEEAASYAANKGGYEHGTHRPYRQSKEDLEALLPVIQGKMPLLVGVHRVADIRRTLELGKRLKLKLILDGVEEGWMMAPEIAASGVPVVVDPLANLPRDFESLNARLENAAILQAAGATVVIKGPYVGHYARQVRYNAGNAVAHGMPWPAALAAITATPAKVFGFSDRAGSIEPGRDADLVVWSGDPLEILSVAEHVFVRGTEAPLTSRAQDLAHRYQTPDAALPPAYRN